MGGEVEHLGVGEKQSVHSGLQPFYSSDVVSALHRQIHMNLWFVLNAFRGNESQADVILIIYVIHEANTRNICCCSLNVFIDLSGNMQHLEMVYLCLCGGWRRAPHLTRSTFLHMFSHPNIVVQLLRGVVFTISVSAKHSSVALARLFIPDEGSLLLRFFLKFLHFFEQTQNFIVYNINEVIIPF